MNDRPSISGRRTRLRIVANKVSPSMCSCHEMSHFFWTWICVCSVRRYDIDAHIFARLTSGEQISNDPVARVPFSTVEPRWWSSQVTLLPWFHSLYQKPNLQMVLPTSSPQRNSDNRLFSFRCHRSISQAILAVHDSRSIRTSWPLGFRSSSPTVSWSYPYKSNCLSQCYNLAQHWIQNFSFVVVQGFASSLDHCRSWWRLLLDPTYRLESLSNRPLKSS